jgi:ABC-type Na+ efflux pump permease subunit
MVLPAFVAVILITSCTESKTTKEEEVKIHTMDSTSKAAKETAENLAEQTRKVENSIEKLDKQDAAK